MATFGIDNEKDLQKWGISIDDINTKTPYITNPWVYSAVSKRTKNIASVPWNIYSKQSVSNNINNIIDTLQLKFPKTDKNNIVKQLHNLDIIRSLRPIDTEVDRQSAQYKLFMQPNPLMDTFEFIKSILQYCLLPPGDCFLLCLNSNNEPVTTREEVPNSIYIIPGCEVTAKTSPEVSKQPTNTKLQLFEGWEWNSKTYKDFQLQRFRLDVNPYNYFRGIDPLSSAMSYFVQDGISNQYNEKFFKQGAMPSGYLQIDGKVDDNLKTELETKWQNRYSGAQNAGKTPLLSGGLKFIQTESNHRDMQFIELKKFSREAIFCVYDTPQTEVGLTDGTNNSITLSLDYGFWRNTLIPDIKKLEIFFEWRFFNKTDNFLAFDLSVVEALRKDLTEKSKIARQFWEIGYPINLINERLELGMGKVEYGELQFSAPGFLPITLMLSKMQAEIDSIKKGTLAAGNSPNNQDNNVGSKGSNKSLNAQKILYKLRVSLLTGKLDSDKLLSLRRSFEEQVGESEVKIFDYIVKNIPRQEDLIKDYFNETRNILKEIED